MTRVRFPNNAHSYCTKKTLWFPNSLFSLLLVISEEAESIFLALTVVICAFFNMREICFREMNVQVSRDIEVKIQLVHVCMQYDVYR